MSVDTDTTTAVAAAPVEDTSAHDATVESFKALATAAVDLADDTTGTVPDGEVSRVAKAYSDITGGAKFKNAARKFVEESMKAALGNGIAGVPKAVAWNALGDGIKTAPKPERESAPAVTPNQAFAQRAQSIELALDLVLDGDLPEGVTEEWEADREVVDVDDAKSYLRWTLTDKESRGDEPEVSALVKAAVKIATGKGPRKAGRPAGTPFNGTRRDVAAHIREVFDARESGEFLTISQIANADSSVYGDDHPSTGAVSNRIYPPNGKPSELLDVLTPGENNAGTKGASRN